MVEAEEDFPEAEALEEVEEVSPGVPTGASTSLNDPQDLRPL